MKKLLVFAILGLLTVVAVVTAIGYALPQGHIASRETTFAAPAAAVFAAVSDVARYPEWRSDVSKIDVLQSDPLHWREYSGGDAVTFEVMESKRDQRFQVRIADAGLPFGGTWTYELRAEGAGTSLTLTEDGEVYNPMFRVMQKLFFSPYKTIDTYLENLKKHLR